MRATNLPRAASHVAFPISECGQIDGNHRPSPTFHRVPPAICLHTSLLSFLPLPVSPLILAGRCRSVPASRSSAMGSQARNALPQMLKPVMLLLYSFIHMIPPSITRTSTRTRQSVERRFYTASGTPRCRCNLPQCKLETGNRAARVSQILPHSRVACGCWVLTLLRPIEVQCCATPLLFPLPMILPPG